MSAIRALILDFDGVILESNDLKTAAFERVFGRFPEHAGAMMDYHRAHVPESRYAKFRHLVVDRLGRPADDPLLEELAEAFSAETRRQVAACPMVEGAGAFLDDVTARVPVFLASVTPQAELDAILDLRGLRRYFERAYGCPPWTKASAIADILTGLDGPQGVVFVGDSAGDQRAGAATGVEFIARDSGLPFDSPLPPRGRDMHEVHAMLAPRLPAPSRSRS
jgi:phosphoglycolate phosphatase-like HAD superfamily hydrolase